MYLIAKTMSLNNKKKEKRTITARECEDQCSSPTRHPLQSSRRFPCVSITVSFRRHTMTEGSVPLYERRVVPVSGLRKAWDV